MAVVIDATLNGASSNSYQTLADAELIAANVPGGDVWIALTEEEKNVSLITACFWLETLDYRGVVCTAALSAAHPLFRMDFTTLFFLSMLKCSRWARRMPA